MDEAKIKETLDRLREQTGFDPAAVTSSSITRDIRANTYLLPKEKKRRKSRSAKKKH